MGPRAVLDAVVRRKIVSLRQESNPRTPIVQPVTQRRDLKMRRISVNCVILRSFFHRFPKFPHFYE
jgi:hypothetical protein